MRIRATFFACLMAFIGAISFSNVAAADEKEDSSLLYFGAGAWQVTRPDDMEAEFNIAYRPNYQLWIFKPHFGVMAAGDGNYYGYGGLLVDFYWGDHVVTTLSTAAGFNGGGGYDMGSHAQFRSGIDLAYRFDSNARLGIGFFHMSNAGLADHNPGGESLLVTYSHPVDF